MCLNYTIQIRIPVDEDIFKYKLFEAAVKLSKLTNLINFTNFKNFSILAN